MNKKFQRLSALVLALALAIGTTATVLANEGAEDGEEFIAAVSEELEADEPADEVEETIVTVVEAELVDGEVTVTVETELVDEDGYIDAVAIADVLDDGIPVSPATTVVLQNPGTLSQVTLQAIVNAAGAATPVLVQADNFESGTSNVNVRISFNPASVVGEINLEASTYSFNAVAVRNHYLRHFGGFTSVVNLGQRTDFTAPVRIAAVVESYLLANTDSLFFYSHDTQTNTFRTFTPQNVWADDSGYLHFTTTYAGDIVISNVNFDHIVVG